MEEVSSKMSNSSTDGYTLSESISEFLAYIDGVRNLSPHSVEAYSRDLSKLHEFLFIRKYGNVSVSKLSCIYVNEITIEDLRYCIGVFSREHKAIASINRFIAAVRNFFAYCRRFSYIKNNIALEFKTIKNSVKIPRFMTEDEVDTLCEQPHLKHILWENRDKALFEMLYSSGCRVSEITSLSIADFSEMKDSAMITGKGGKDRRVYFSDEAVFALKEYLPERKEKLVRLKTATNAVFINQKGTRISSGGVEYIVRRYSSLEGSNKPVTPHAFRHTFATQLLNNGADVRVVQELLGHSSISTTQRYTHVTNKRMIELYNMAHPHGDK